MGKVEGQPCPAEGLAGAQSLWEGASGVRASVAGAELERG